VQSLERVTDFIVHELTHHRQHQLEAEHKGDPAWVRKRDDSHRNRGWYQAISEAAPKYLGVEFPQSSWPTGPRPHKKGDPTLTEVEAGHWPTMFHYLVAEEDPRLPKCTRTQNTVPRSPITLNFCGIGNRALRAKPAETLALCRPSSDDASAPYLKRSRARYADKLWDLFQPDDGRPGIIGRARRRRSPDPETGTYDAWLPRSDGGLGCSNFLDFG
jgi:hypothetical protein